MDIQQTKLYEGTPFSILCEASNDENTRSIISIYRDNILIGKYMRNLSSYGITTFFPFSTSDGWFALYSCDFPYTRIMKLNDKSILDWCDVENTEDVFCPVEYYIPRFNRYEYEDSYHYVTECVYDNYTKFQNDTSSEYFIDTQYCNFGFMSGCNVGDESSWKIRYIDLSGVLEKRAEVKSPFGYWKMPDNLTLRECIDMSEWEPSKPIVKLTKVEYINLHDTVL